MWNINEYVKFAISIPVNSNVRLITININNFVNENVKVLWTLRHLWASCYDKNYNIRQNAILDDKCQK